MQYRPLFVVLGAFAACSKSSAPASPATASTSAAATTRPREIVPAYPLLDSRCDEYPGLAQQQHTIAPGMKLFAFQDRDYVWLCYTIPTPNNAPLDMIVTAPALTEPLDIHVSAQLGEWPANREELAPKDASSDMWWNHRDWGAITIPFNGSTPDSKTKWKYMPGRELQIAKTRFGRGSWKLRFKIYNVALEGAEPATIEFPNTGDFELNVW